MKILVYRSITRGCAVLAVLAAFGAPKKWA